MCVDMGIFLSFSLKLNDPIPTSLHFAEIEKEKMGKKRQTWREPRAISVPLIDRGLKATSPQDITAMVKMAEGLGATYEIEGIVLMRDWTSKNVKEENKMEAAKLFLTSICNKVDQIKLATSEVDGVVFVDEEVKSFKQLREFTGKNAHFFFLSPFFWFAFFSSEGPREERRRSRDIWRKGRKKIPCAGKKSTFPLAQCSFSSSLSLSSVRSSFK